MVTILAFSDTHDGTKYLERIKKAAVELRPDVIVCVGDFTSFGRHMKKLLEQINALPAPVVLIHGNHEDLEELELLLPACKNVHFAHAGVVDVAGLRFMGWGGGGFRQREPDFEEYERECAKSFTSKTVFLCHQPPYGTKLDEVEPDWHVGSQTLRSLIQRRKPVVVFSGHIHECFHVHDTLAGVLLVNPGPDGEIIEVADE